MDVRPESQSPEFIRFMADVKNLREKRKKESEKNGNKENKD